MRYPVATFAHLDDVPETPHESTRVSFQREPNANSTMIESCPSQRCSRHESSPLNSTSRRNSTIQSHGGCESPECPSYSVGHISHIPRVPPTPGTYTVPSIINRSTIGTECPQEEDLYGMIKLKENDVCYTSGTIEWVGRKRSFPINSGFKIMNDNPKQGNEPVLKRVKRLDKTFTCGMDKLKDCDCADVLPTVNAIVDHLNAIHEAVDIVDLRLDTIEDVMSKNVKNIC